MVPAKASTMDMKKNWPFEITSLVLVVVISLAGWLISGSHKVPAGVLIGGLIGLINFKWLGSIVKGALSEDRAARYTARYLLKFLFVVTTSALLIFSCVVDPLGFITGFTLIVIMVSLSGTEFIRS